MTTRTRRRLLFALLAGPLVLAVAVWWFWPRTAVVPDSTAKTQEDVLANELESLLAGVAIPPTDAWFNPPQLYNAQFSPDGKQLLARFYQTTIRPHRENPMLWAAFIYDATTGKRLGPAPGRDYYSEPRWCAFVPNTTSLLAIKPSPDGHERLVLWDWKTGAVVREFQPPTDYIGSVVASPDGQIVLTGHLDARIRVWDVASGTQPRSFDVPPELEFSTGNIPYLFFVAGGARVVAGSGSVIRIWDAATGKQVGSDFQEHAAAQQRSYHDSCACSADGRLLCTALTHADRKNPLLRIWNLTTGKLQHEWSFSEEAIFRISMVGFTADGGRVLTLDWRTNRLGVWDVATEKATAGRIVSGVRCVSSDGRFALVVNRHSAMGLWDIAREKVVWATNVEGTP
jgi:WD40 repeat protein